jgi:hypothetical protein
VKKVLLVTLLVFVSCTKKIEEETADRGNFTAEAIAKINAVSEDFAPASLDSGMSGNSVGAMDGNPCANSNGLIDCQPELLKLYLSVSKQQLDMVSELASNIGSALGDIEDGTSGSFTDVDGIVEYNKTDSSNWTVTLKNASTSNVAVYVSIASGTYTLEFDMANLPPEDGAPTQGKYQTVINFTDENTWDMTSTMLNQECNADDVRAPQNIRIKMSKASGLWKGKAMLYHPRWAQFSPDPTCATTPSDSIGLNMYSDFVADHAVAKMNVYMVKRTRALNDIVSHPLSDICNEYAGLCSGGTLGAETPASYPNSVCVEASDGDANWNSDCSAAPSGTTVSAASFGASSDWIAPSSFYNYDVTVGP